MKGISHFAVGVAVASCFPDAVRAGAAGNPVYFLLGGIAGLLPDTLDFKFYRYFYRHDIEVMPDPKAFDPGVIADAVALAVNRAWTNREPVVIKLDTVRLGADLWQQYTVTFDTRKREVLVTRGPVVTTSRVPYAASPGNAASSRLVCGIRPDYEVTTTVDIFDGPVFRMEPLPDGRVMPEFIPWHRQWSHSLTFALLAGAMVWVAGGVLAGCISALAVVAHTAVDQCGFLGSNLFFPWTKRRATGLQLAHSDRSLPNFCVVVSAVAIVFWNLYYAHAPIFPHFTVVKLLLYVLVIPLAVVLLLHRVLEGRKGTNR